jgi:hypothetical protein
MRASLKGKHLLCFFIKLGLRLAMQPDQHIFAGAIFESLTCELHWRM